MAIEISLKKSTANPTSASGLTLAEPVFNYSNNTLWIGKGSGNSPVWVGAGVCGASGGIAAGLTTQLPTHAAVKNYFDAVSSRFLGATVSYVATFNGATGAVTGVSSFNGLTGAVGGVTTSAANTFTALNSFNAGISAAGATLSGTVTAPTPSVGTNNTQVATTAFVQNEIVADTVTTFNGRTGAVQGVSSAAAGTGISISAATGAITITNTGVQTFNGLTGAVTGVTVGGANTFTALNSFAVGISSNGGTFSANTRFLSGIQTDSVVSTTGAGNGGTVYINSDAIGNGGNSITYIGDWSSDWNGTSITVDDQSAAISLNGGVLCNSTVNAAGFNTTGDVYFGGASAFLSSQSTTLGTTAANQTIGSVTVYDFDTASDINRTVEFFVQASHSSGYEALKVIAIYDGTNTYNTQYGLIRTGSSLCSSYTTTIATVVGGNKVIRLRATPTNTNTTFKVVETVIPV